MAAVRRQRIDAVLSWGRQKSLQALLVVALLYLSTVFLLEFPFVARRFSSQSSPAGAGGGSAGMLPRPLRLDSEEDVGEKSSPVRPNKVPHKLLETSAAPLPLHIRRTRRRSSPILSGLSFSFPGNGSSPTALTELHKSAGEAWVVGAKILSELESVGAPIPPLTKHKNKTMAEEEEKEKCPPSITLTAYEISKKSRKALELPCGLTLGSHITVVGRPRPAHLEHDPKITILKDGDESAMVSQFFLELQGLKTVDGEDPPRILHLNPRLKGDWSGRPVIEMNTCYRMQWGIAQRCEGWKSRSDEETVDGLLKCEKWIRDDDVGSEESKATWWLNRLIGLGRTKKVDLDWPYPFVEDKLFVLTLSARLEGYHVNVDGRHVSSFPYRTGFVLEDATGLFLNGYLDIDSIFAASLPTTHPSFAPQRHLEMLSEWQALPLPEGPVELFIGILSAGNHFAERMAVRKSWMVAIRKSSNIVARFFVALNGRKDVNVELKKEAEYFGDIVIVPFMDSYDLVVLKTVAICEYGVRTVSAKYIMKCDDDTFVRVDAVLNEVKKVSEGGSVYIGNINYHHKPLRYGKWAVTYEEWPEEDYPPYANGPGYVVSADIAHFIVSEFEKHTLRLFKMEDVSMGMWVEQFNTSTPVVLLHSLKFCQFGCIEDYYTAHYQSPRQMLCMWDKLQKGKPQCCNMR